MRNATALLLAFALLARFTVAEATPLLHVDGAGQLTGATGVRVGDFGTYNVVFIEGTCIDVFSGCDESSDFDFNSSAETIAASRALLDQVFIGQFDDDPTLTLGCSDVDLCSAFTPAEAFLFVHDPGYVSGTAASNTALGSAIGNYLAPNGDYGPLINRDLTTDESLPGGDGARVWARWSPSVSVPEPSALALLALSLVGLGLNRRKPKGFHG